MPIRAFKAGPIISYLGRCEGQLMVVCHSRSGDSSRFAHQISCCADPHKVVERLLQHGTSESSQSSAFAANVAAPPSRRALTSSRYRHHQLISRFGYDRYRLQTSAYR